MKRKALSATVVSALLCVSVMWAPSCSTPPLTEIIVHVDSVFLDGDLDLIRLIILRDGEAREVTTPVSEGVPFTQGIVHRGGSFDISISAKGISGDTVVVEQVVPVERFIEGETRHVRVVLSPSCINVMCDDGSACVAGVCVSTSIDAGVADVGPSDVGIFDARPLVDTLPGPLNPGECPSEPIEIVGDYICAADCPDCSLRCEGNCSVICRSGATCSVESDEYEIDANCEEGSICNLQTKRRGGVNAQCVWATCNVDCDGNGPCNTQCAQGNCGVACSKNKNCNLRGCLSEECGGNLSVCGRDCP